MHISEKTEEAISARLSGRTLFHQLSTPALMLDPNPPCFRLIEANQAFGNLTHLNPEALSGSYIYDILVRVLHCSGKTVSDMIRSLERVVKEKVAHGSDILEYSIKDPDGQLNSGYWRYDNKPILNSNGKLKFIFQQITDVTEQVASRQMAHDLEQRYLHLIQDLPAAIYSCDTEGRVNLYNRAAVTLWGRKPDIERDRWCGCWKSYGTDGRPLDLEKSPVATAVRTGNAIRDKEVIIERPDGSRRRVMVHPTPTFDCDGKVTGAVNMLVDITAIREAESEKEQLIRKLTRHNEDLRQFSYITSHNLRSPISNLANLMYLAENLKIEDENLKEIFEDIRSSSTLLNHTIDDLAKVLVIKEHPAMEREELSLSEMIEETCSCYRDEIEELRPRIVKDLDRAPTVVFNRDYMRNILSNLLSNSLKFRATGRPLEITIRSEDLEDHTLFIFSDNGVGLDVERYRDRLFGFYQRFHTHSISKGLGMYLVKAQVEALNGSIEAKSRAGEGMTIEILFPKHLE